MSQMLPAVLGLLACALLLLPAYAIAGVFLGVATAARAIGRRLEPASVPWTELIAFDRELGWRPRPRLDTHYLCESDDVFRIVTDAEGWPGARTIEESEILAIGDSFAFGYGVDTRHTFAEIDPGLRVKGVGAPGYSMVHGVRLMEQLGSRMRGKLVVWLVFLENDLQDNLCPELRGYRMPFAATDGQGRWRIVDEHVSAKPWNCSLLDYRRLFPRFCAPGPMADRAYAACEYLIGRAVAVCDAAGATLVMVTIPHVAQLTAKGVAELAARSGNPAACDPGLPDRRLAAICEQAGISLVPAASVLTSADYKAREGVHWNRRGHRRMAELLREVKELQSAFAGERPRLEIHASAAVESVTTSR